MNTNVWIKTSLAGAVALTLAACGSRGGDIDLGGPFKSLSSTVTLGNPVSGSACDVAPFNNRTNELDSGTTDTAGKVAFEIPEATTIALISCTGGTYTPKATAGDITVVVPPGITDAQANALSTLLADYLVAQPSGTITTLADLLAQTVNIFKALGLEGISYDAFVAGNLSTELSRQIALVAITLANDPALADQLSAAVIAGFIPAALAADLNEAIQETYADLPAAEQPNTVPTSPGGTTTPTGGTGTGGST